MVGKMLKMQIQLAVKFKKSNPPDNFPVVFLSPQNVVLN